MQEVLLVRHGEAHCNTGGYLASDTCQGLTDGGRQQAACLARRLHREQQEGSPVTRLLSSPIRRARDTAETIAGGLGIDVVVESQLRVPDLGPNADGCTFEELRRRWPPDPAKPGKVLIDGGEAWSQYLARAHSCLGNVLAGHSGGRIVIVGHSETISAVVSLLVGVSTLGVLAISSSHTGITQLVAVEEYPHVPVMAQRWALTKHNDTTHLPHRSRPPT
jgi:probable phosphoglycerate mutase